MKTRLTFFLIAFATKTILAQSITLTPGRTETSSSVFSHIVLKEHLSPPRIQTVRQGGTYASPSDVLNGLDLLSIEAGGWVAGAATADKGRMTFTATQNWTNTQKGTKFELFTTANDEDTPFVRMLVNHNGKIGVGNYFLLEPDHQLEVQQLGTSDKGVGIYRFGGSAPAYFGIAARGNINSPMALDSADLLARFGGKGHNGIAYTTARARIDMQANKNWTSTSTGTDMKFYTTKKGEIDPTLNMIIKGNGNVGIGTSEPGATLGINGDLRFFSTTTVLGSNELVLNRDGKSLIHLEIQSGNLDISGISGGVDGLVVHITSKGPYNLTFKNNETSVGANKIITGSNNITINNEGGAIFIYDGTDLVWRVLGFNN
jgi:hypothetical protein